MLDVKRVGGVGERKERVVGDMTYARWSKLKEMQRGRCGDRGIEEEQGDKLSLPKYTCNSAC